MRWLIMLILLTAACTRHSNAINTDAPKKTFVLWDLNHDGSISHVEWSISWARSLAKIPEQNRQKSKGYVEDDFRTLDRNHDGKITYDEYVGH